MRLSIVAALVAIAGCGGSGNDAGGLLPGGTYSCRAAFPGADGGAGTVVLCLEASGGTAQDLSKNRQQCAAQGNTFVSEPCPREGVLGGCRETAAGVAIVLTTWYYAEGTGTADDIRMLCEGLASIAPSALMIRFVRP
ncbi:MAG: hypothetical protein ABJA82_02520 [Myxococcales bacterium]